MKSTAVLVSCLFSAIAMAQKSLPPSPQHMDISSAAPPTQVAFSVTNPCSSPHYFRLKTDAADLHLDATSGAILVPAKSTAAVDATADQGKVKAQYTMDVVCLDCKSDSSCVQNRHIALTAAPTHLDTARVSIRSSAPTPAAQSGGHDVGVIAPPSGVCPVGSEHIFISMDDEDSNNQSSVSGWTGQISRYSTGTTFGFCRVDGDQFHNLPVRNYAVLQLSGTCPAGSVSIFRVFDNEHNGNNNWSSGNISPNQSGPPTTLSFCMFIGGVTSNLPSFPNFYVRYGVFAAPPSPVGLATGVVHTDDEDTNNHDYSYSTAVSAPMGPFSQIIYGTDQPLGGRNTNLLVAQASNGGTCTTPCPYLGSYDGANCQVGQPPAGTSAFIYANNFYYTPMNGNPKCPKPGSWFDSANCFVMTIPPQTTPFIWANWWYVAPVCRP
jgi:hypothetical protein